MKRTAQTQVISSVGEPCNRTRLAKMTSRATQISSQQATNERTSCL